MITPQIQVVNLTTEQPHQIEIHLEHPPEQHYPINTTALYVYGQMNLNVRGQILETRVFFPTTWGEYK